MRGPASTLRTTTKSWFIFVFPSSPTPLTPKPYAPLISWTTQPEPSAWRIRQRPCIWQWRQNWQRRDRPNISARENDTTMRRRRGEWHDEKEGGNDTVMWRRSGKWHDDEEEGGNDTGGGGGGKGHGEGGGNDDAGDRSQLNPNIGQRQWAEAKDGKSELTTVNTTQPQQYEPSDSESTPTCRSIRGCRECSKHNPNISNCSPTWCLEPNANMLNDTRHDKPNIDEGQGKTLADISIQSNEGYWGWVLRAASIIFNFLVCSMYQYTNPGRHSLFRGQYTYLLQTEPSRSKMKPKEPNLGVPA